MSAADKLYFNVSESYLEWLKSYTIDEQVEDSRRLTYEHLSDILWDTEFVPPLGNDIDRMYDGLDLRRKYWNTMASNSGVTLTGEAIDDFSDIFGPCRVLEMLIALSMHMYDIMQDLGVYNSVSRWFWEIMRCLGFDEMSDISWEDLDKQMVIIELQRAMSLQGEECGGWFYIYGWKHLEIWYQMHRYLARYF